MKKIISFILILICLTSLCSCDRVKEVISRFEYTEGLSAYVIEDDQCIVSVGEDMRDIEVVNVPRRIDDNLVVGVDRRGFAFLDNLRSVRLPISVYHIGDEAFMYSFSLETVELPAGVTHIGRGAFNGCRALKSISLSEGLLRIEERTFYYCESLTEINLPKSLTYIGTNAFTCCGFTELTIPEGVTFIGEYAFSGCESLTTVYIPEGARVCRYVFNGCDALERVVYGGSEEQWEAMMRDNSYGYEDKSYVKVEIIFEK